MRRLLIILALLLSACAPTTPSPEETRAIGEGAMKSYLDAINTNDARRVLAVMTDDIVMMPPHEPALIGKAKVGQWVEGYFGAYAARWEKTSEEFIVFGDAAFERYRYHAFDTARTGDVRLEDVGKGVILYRRGADGRWRVARDAWSSDNPMTAE